MIQTALKSVYSFKSGHREMKDLLGSKGANLAEMVQLGLPIPPGFILTTAVCNQYLSREQHLSERLMAEVNEALNLVEHELGQVYGDPEKPLLLSVRSGAKISMPGMMETVLNLGLNEETLGGLIRQSGNEWFAYDTYRRFVQMFGSVVMGVPKAYFDDLLTHQKLRWGIAEDSRLSVIMMRQLVNAYKEVILDRTGQTFPDSPQKQLRLAIEAVFRSWQTPRAIAYRNHQKIDHALGTAAIVQAMVFGNLGADSVTGVAFTRNPANGDKELYGEYLVNAQGEDVVAGLRTPEKLSALAVEMPRIYQELSEVAYRLEQHYREVQDMEFTVERGRLYVLQTRTGKRTVQAAVKIAVDMVEEGLLTREEALLRIDANQLSQLYVPAFNPAEKAKARRAGRLLAVGLNASPGAATGKLVFDPDEAMQWSERGEAVILCRVETCPDDIHGILAARGILTARGGNTSHASVVARGLGKPCVAGCEACQVDLGAETLTVQGRTFSKGVVISIDGSTGEVYEGALDAETPTSHNAALDALLCWADELRRLEVRANADTPADTLKALEMGAQGIGLCRTEHMFMGVDRLPVVRQLILAQSSRERRQALALLLPMQRADFKTLLEIMSGKPVTIRLLDPPLHEFLPNREEVQAEMLALKQADPYQIAYQEKRRLLGKIDELREVNPMMGFRGCRLGLVYPEIYEMQVRAIFEAACQVVAQGGLVRLEIMIPLVGFATELKQIQQQLDAVAQRVMGEHQCGVDYWFGTMIEVPRAALVADELAQYARFFSFGTNDLTQLTLGFSRDDSEGRFLTRYLEKNILEHNPFETLDIEGVGRLMMLARDQGRQARPDLKLGLCGEHGGEAQSVQFAHRIRLDYVSCSALRIPVARVAAAQAVILGVAEDVGFDSRPFPRLGT
ncbi:pyruvate, phosphate dikinase [Vampirovibrio chlorellavorus]|uniref:pyruvate, phosphate dikinase n=1 Tax=Vampirovibrio chlorellavorus TaxID=758823 RepID=UPI0026F1B114|nr:pyruvate, phosphate dikinase [Vampirovibrio chlorellavorus]